MQMYGSMTIGLPSATEKEKEISSRVGDGYDKFVFTLGKL